MVLGATALTGCATQSPEVRVPAAEYAEAFTAARDVLHSYRFTLDRIDARAGMLTTQASRSAGFFTPWNQLDSTVGQAWEDTIHKQQRRVEIVFSVTPTPETREADLRPSQARELASDLIESPRDTTARVLVVVERIYQFGWRPNTKSTALTSLTEDTQPDATSQAAVDISDDPALAGRIASDIRALLARRTTAGATTPSPPRTQEPEQQAAPQLPVEQPGQQLPPQQQVVEPASAPAR